MKLKKDPKGGKAPVPYLTPSGPDMDFKVSRVIMCVGCPQCVFHYPVADEDQNALELLREIMQDNTYPSRGPPYLVFFVVSIGKLLFGFASPLPLS
jgi:hypothetical protein